MGIDRDKRIEENAGYDHFWLEEKGEPRTLFNEYDDGVAATLKREESDSAQLAFKKQYALFQYSIKKFSFIKPEDLSPALRNDKTFALACTWNFKYFNKELFSDREVTLSVLYALDGFQSTAVLPYLNHREKNNKKFWFDVLVNNNKIRSILGHLDVLDDKAFLLAISSKFTKEELFFLPFLHPELTQLCNKFQKDYVLSQAAQFSYTFLWRVLAASILTLAAVVIGLLIISSVIAAPLSVGIVLTTAASLTALGLFGRTIKHQKDVSMLKQEADRRFINNPNTDDPDGNFVLNF